jgi:hypothetical protein
MAIQDFRRPEEKKESDFDKVLKGLQVAQSVYGTYIDTQKVEAMKADTEQKKSDAQLQREQFKLAQNKDAREAEAAARGARNIITPKELDGFQVSKTQVEGFSPAELPDGTKIFIKAKPREFDPNASLRVQGLLDERNNRQVEKLQTKLSPLQDIQNSIGTAESQMGFTLDEYDPETNTANGKEVDLPGVSVPLLGRLTAHSNKARDLNTAMSRVFNVELKDRSGAAVTSPELARLKQEFGEGKFNTEAEMLRAMKDYQRAATMAMKNTEAGYTPTAVETYNDRGGMTSRNLPNPFKGAKTEEQIAGGLKNAPAGDEQNAAKLELIKRQGIKAGIPKGGQKRGG